MSDHPTAEKLLPCPFCGGEASYEYVERGYGAIEEHRWSVGCRDESCIGYQSMATFSRKREARESWNRRASK